MEIKDLCNLLLSLMNGWISDESDNRYTFYQLKYK